MLHFLERLTTEDCEKNPGGLSKIDLARPTFGNEISAPMML